MNISTIAFSLISLTLTFFIFSVGKDLLIPFILALIVWFIIKTIRKSLMKIPKLEKCPPVLLTIGASVVIFAVISVSIKLLTLNIQDLSQSLPLYEKNIDSVVKSINSRFDIDVASYIKGLTKNFNYSSVLSGIFSSLTSVFGNTFMILIYTLFLLIEEKLFNKKLLKIYPNQEEYNRVSLVISRIDKSISDYITLKTMVSFLTGFLSFIVLSIIGVDVPLFWAFLIFLMNYIPNIGSLLATIFPAIFATLQFGELSAFFGVLLGVGVIQMIIGNIVEPKVMGNSLNISSLVVLITLALWGTIWGITGMILSVPITVMMIIVLSEIESTKKIAILLSKEGEV